MKESGSKGDFKAESDVSPCKGVQSGRKMLGGGPVPSEGRARRGSTAFLTTCRRSGPRGPLKVTATWMDRGQVGAGRGSLVEGIREVPNLTLLSLLRFIGCNRVLRKEGNVCYR